MSKMKAIETVIFIIIIILIASQLYYHITNVGHECIVYLVRGPVGVYQIVDGKCFYEVKTNLSTNDYNNINRYINITITFTSGHDRRITIDKSSLRRIGNKYMINYIGYCTKKEIPEEYLISIGKCGKYITGKFARLEYPAETASHLICNRLLWNNSGGIETLSFYVTIIPKIISPPSINASRETPYFNVNYVNVTLHTTANKNLTVIFTHDTTGTGFSIESIDNGIANAQLSSTTARITLGKIARMDFFFIVGNICKEGYVSSITGEIVVSGNNGKTYTISFKLPRVDNVKNPNC